MMEAPQRELNTLMLQNKNLLHAFDYPRAGSAPPQMDEGGSPMAGVAPKFSIFGSPHGAVAPSVGDGPQPVNDFGLSESKLDLANPEYIRYYYANKNINPRLPPPTVGRSNLLHGGKAPEYVEHGSLGGQVQHDAADAQAALNILLSSQLGLKDDETSTSPIPIHSRSFAQSHSHIRHPSQQGGDQFAPGSWTARIGPATDHLDALLQAYSSPQTLSPLVSGDLSNAHQNTSLFSSLRADDATLQDALFNGGSAPHTPRSSSHANLLFDATVGSPPQSKRDGILSSQDPQVAVGPQLSSTVGSQLSSTARSVLDPTGRGSLRKREPSKLRQSSNNVDFSDPHVDLLGSNVSHMSDAVSNAAQATAITEALQNLPQGLLPSMLPGMAPEPMAGMGMGMGPGGMEALLGNQGGMGQGMQHQSQLQNMYGYMAAMYPYYAQQAMQAAGGGGYPGFMGMPGMPGMNGMGPMMGYPGFPMMNQGGFPGGPGMPDLRAGFAMMPPGGGFPLQMPGMMPFGPMGGIMPPEYAGYYQKVMEEQAAMAAAVGGKGMDDSHGHGDLKGMRPPGHGMPDGINEGMPGLNGNANRRHQRDMMSPERQQHRPMNAREVGRGSPVSRRENSARDGGMGSGLPGATARKVNSRREEDKPVDAMLEEFKNNKNKKFELKDIFGHVFEFSLDQHGSRFIQQKLESVPPEELSEALEEVLPKVVTLMTDVFGNYVVQKFLEHGSPEHRISRHSLHSIMKLAKLSQKAEKFLEHGSPEHRLQLAQALKGNVLSLSLQMYGCRIVQKALEVLPTDVQCEIVAELDGQVMRCVRDQNGNHVIQKIIECVPTARVLHLLDSLLTCVVPLSSHPFGCRVVQRILEHCQDAKRRGVVMDEILKSTCLLSQDQYGNYVIQHVLERGTPAERMQVVTQMAPEIVAMAMHKFASNVVEKCLIFCSVAERDVLIHSMLGDGAATAEDDPLQLMMKDQFGNYVVQKVLEVCDDVQRELLLGRVRMQLHALKKYTYAKHIVSRVEKLLATGQKLQTSSRQGDRALPDDSELQSLQVMQQLNVLLPGADANAAAAPQGAGVSAAAAGEGAAAGAQEGSAQSAAPETAGIQDEASAAAAVAKDSQSLHDAGLAAAPAGAGDSETGTPGRDEVPPKRLGSEGGVADGTGTVGADGAS